MIHLVMGPPCSGKSTFVAESAPFGTPRFDFDLVASTVAGGDVGHDPAREVLDPVVAMRRGFVGWLLDPETEPGDVWLIHANPPQSMVERFAALGAQLHILDPGKETCLARAAEDGRPPGTVARINAWYAAPPKIPENLKGGDDSVIKNFDVEFKAGDDSPGDTGEIVAYASVFDNVDSYGDVVRRGAFAESLKEWEQSGDNIPLLYGHDFSDPFSNIGAVSEAVEDEKGLRITARLDLDNPKAAQVHRLIKDKRLKKMSFAYRTLDSKLGEVDGEQVRELTRLKLIEVSVVGIPANEESEILAVKSAAELVSTAVKQADNFSDSDRGALALLFAKAADELSAPGGRAVSAEKSVEKEKSLARARLARAELLLLKGACNEPE
ncbi:HK97 family phage prohead protease [Corynebacterium phocae]|nr:HK97 family phage prohead protease [Corynebacterium phocae]